MSAQKGPTVDKTVLVVEDNPTNLKLIRDLLELLECRVLEANRAEDAIKMIEDQEVSLVLMDIQLPGMDGLTAVRVIREDLGYRDLPIVGVSAMAMEGDRESAFEAGCCDYLTKPIDTRAFLQMVRQCLSGVKHCPAADRRGTGRNVERRRVLIVDDNPVNIKLLKTMLPQEKYEILEAGDGASALQVAEDGLPDVIFLDIMMPDMNGYEVTKHLKQNSTTADIPVVLVTALEGTDDRIRGLEAGAEDVLAKPVNRVELIARARSMVRLYDFRKQVFLRKEAAGIFNQSDETRKDGQKDPTAKVLVVEDNVQELGLLKACLAGEPYEVLTSGNGQEALDLLRDNDIDLIILDILLPDMNGFDVLEKVKGMKGHGAVQTVVTTCLDDMKNKVRGIELGADDYIVKPINARELKVRLKALLKKKRYMDQLRRGYPGDIDSTIKDPLTNTYNRDFFIRFMELELKRAARHEYSTSMVKIAIGDHDQFSGQEENTRADKLLLEVSAVLKNTLREIDLVARCEDAGFAMLLPNCDETGARNVVIRIQEALTDRNVHYSDELVPEHISANFVAVTFPSEVKTVEEMFDLVEDRLQNIEPTVGTGSGMKLSEDRAVSRDKV